MMKIIISPSKLQSPHISGKVLKKPLFERKSQNLRTKLEKMSRSELTVFFKLKQAKADEVYALFQNEWNESYAPFELFSGIAFKEINVQLYDEIQLLYLQKHAVILSSLYGIIEADSALRPYRLDFSRKLDGINLYDYWQDEIDAYFKNCDLVLNLASKEYSKLLKNYQGKMLNIFFKERRVDGKLKTVTVHSKQMRGIMFDYIICNCITRVDELKKFNENGYYFSEKLSTDCDWVFIKEV